MTNFLIFENFWADGSLKCSRKHQKCCRHERKYIDNAYISCFERLLFQIGAKVKVFVPKQKGQGRFHKYVYATELVDLSVSNLGT